MGVRSLLCDQMIGVPTMSTKRIFSAALALLLVAAIPARATSVPTLTVIDTINPGAGGSYAMDASDSVALGDFLYFQADDGTHGNELWRTDGTVTERVPFPVAGQIINCDCYDTSIVAVGGRLYTTVYSSDIGHEFAYLDEPLPETSRDGSLWTATLVILAGLTAAASIGLRLRGARRT